MLHWWKKFCRSYLNLEFHVRHGMEATRTGRNKCFGRKYFLEGCVDLITDIRAKEGEKNT